MTSFKVSFYIRCIITIDTFQIVQFEETLQSWCETQREGNTVVESLQGVIRKEKVTQL